MDDKLRVVHFLNQFYGGIGGEEKANEPIQILEGSVGPGRLLESFLGDDGLIVGTLVSGDNYLSENAAKASEEVRGALNKLKPNVVVAGPAFDAGRYGIACAWVCKTAQEEGIPAVTAMFPENPGRIEFRRDLIVVPTSSSPLDMESAMREMARLAIRLGSGEQLGPADEEGYLPRGFRKPGSRELPAAQRAVQMLTAKMSDLPFNTELPIEMPERVAPAPPLTNLKEAMLCLASSGGIVPRGNPERLPGGPADVWWKYSIEGMDSMTPDKWECVHRGFHTELANRDPNLVVPLNVVRQMEKEGVIGRILPIYYGTSGRGTSVGVSERLGAEMAQEMVDAGVDGCLFVAT